MRTSAGFDGAAASWQPGDPMPRLLQEELSLASSRATDFQRALRVILRRLCCELDWDFGEAWVPSRDGSVLKPGPVWPRSNPQYLPYRRASRRLGFLPGGGLPGRAWLGRAPVAVADIEAEAASDFTRRDSALETGFHTAAAIPLLAGAEEVVAVVVLYRCRQGGADDRELEMLRHVVAPLGPVLAQKRVEVELAARERQQKSVAHLGMAALADETDLDTLLDTAVRLTAATLGIGHCMLVEYRIGSEKLQLRAGVGWRPGTAEGSEMLAGATTQAGYTLQSREPVIVPDFDREERFRPGALLQDHGIVSGLSVVVYGHEMPFGVLSVHGQQRRSFTRDDVHFLQAIANVIGSTIDRKRVEGELEEHRQHLETLVARRTTQLEKSHERLRLAERLASVGTLAAGLGHDLGNTILPMLCRLDALAARQLPESAREDIGAVRHAVDYLRQLSQGLRHLALDKDHRPAGGGHTNLADWWKQAAPLLQSALPEHVKLYCDLAPSLPSVAVAPHRLTQAVLNLVSNAAEAIVGSGQVAVRGEVEEGGTAVRLSVTDDGKGMTEDARRHALEPFFTTKTRGLSTGLGLALVHGIAKGSGGSVDIESSDGEGTSVHVSLPTTAAASVSEVIDEDAALDAPLLAVGISLTDARIAAYASLLVRSAGLDAQTCGPTEPGNCRIWITEPGEETAEAAKRFIEGDARRRVVLFGDEPGRIGPGHFFVDQRGGPDAMRQGLREVVFQLLEEDDEREEDSRPLR
ncbi:MAG: sensor histidine kinase [Planctomycetota bacterium]